MLLVCTPEYGSSPENSGVWRDVQFMQTNLASGGAKPRKFIPVGFGRYEVNSRFIPSFVKGATYYDLSAGANQGFGFGDLLRRFRTEFPVQASGPQDSQDGTMAERIFVSSTFADLKNHRAAVRDVIQKLGARDVSMERLGARDEHPLDECVRLVKEESDLFVSIYAHRYGFVPEGSSVSITEAEYVAATEGGIPRLIFVVNEDVSWQPKLIDHDESRKQLERFKARLRANHVCESFDEPQDLAARVAASVGRKLSRRKLDESFRLLVNGLPTTRATQLMKQKRKNQQRFSCRGSTKKSRIGFTRLLFFVLST